MFSPAETPHWDGNLKKYTLGLDGTEIEIVDADGEEAVDLVTGSFEPGARSFWSVSEDGNLTAVGGAASRLVAGRQIYVDISAAPIAFASSTADHFEVSNGALTNAMFGAPDSATKNKLIEWGRGYDSFGADPMRLRKRLGDILHSRPALVTYGEDVDGDISVVYFATNDGFLHAVDARTGDERFAFIPKSLLANLNGLRKTTTGTKVYGIDGELVVWKSDTDGDGTIEAGRGERVMLYFGLGLGGGSYYALDVTEPSSPRLAWRIDSGDPDFSELGLATSDPVITRVRYGTTTKDALVFAAGYDRHEDSQPPSVDDHGRGVFVVDALTGERLWSGGSSHSSMSNMDDQWPGMSYAIASRVKVLDMNADGYADRLYVGDLGGQVWRFDLNTSISHRLDFEGGVVAKLGITAPGASDPADRRKFFYAPDVALMKNPYGTYLAINIGSGNRSRPKSDTSTEDYFFSLRDQNVYSPPSGFSYTAVSMSELKDVTNDASIARNRAVDGGTFFQDLFNNHDGWRIALGDDEKVLAEAKTFDGTLMFTTYSPASSGAGSCNPDFGTSRFWAVSLAAGDPIEPYNGAADEWRAEDRYVELARDDIPPSVTILFPEINNGRPVALVGTQRAPITFDSNTRRTYWHEVRDE
jgi:type IV pilus assembly protein PilY1